MKTLLAIIWTLCVTNGISAEEVSTNRYKQLAVDKFTETKPSLSPDANFVLTEYQWNNTHDIPIRLFLLRCIDGSGTQFNEMQFYTDGTGSIYLLSSAFGGYGVMSVVSDAESLFLTNSWGSGEHRSEVMAITPSAEGGYQLMVYPEVLQSEDAAIVREEGQLVLRLINYYGYANFETGESLGVVTIEDGRLLIDGSPNKALKGTPLRGAP
jgi:hypothetical protein